MNSKKKKLILLLAAIFFLGLAVALLWPHNDEPVIVKGNLSAQDIKEIKRVALKWHHNNEWEFFKAAIKQREFRLSIEFLKSYYSLKVKGIEAKGPDAVLVTYKPRDDSGFRGDIFTRETNGWHKKLSTGFTPF